MPAPSLKRGDLRDEHPVGSQSGRARARPLIEAARSTVGASVAIARPGGHVPAPSLKLAAVTPAIVGMVVRAGTCPPPH